MNPISLIKKIASVVVDPLSGNTSSTRLGAVSFTGAAITYALTVDNPDHWVLGLLVAGAIMSWVLRVTSDSTGGDNA